MLVRQLTNPQPYVRMRDEMDQIFERFFGTPRAANGPTDSARRGSAPALNAWADGDNIVIEAELPGLTEDDFDVSVHGTQLEIKGQRAPLEPETGATVLRRERSAGTFHRVIHLPMDIDRDAIEAQLRNGVLTVTLPKTAVARARRIPVQASSR